MVLPNPGADAIRMGQGLVEKAEAYEAEVNPGMTVEECNELFDKHLQQMSTSSPFKKGDIVEHNELASLIESPLREGQKALVLMGGKQVQELTGDQRDVLANFINKDGQLERLCIESRFLKKSK